MGTFYLQALTWDVERKVLTRKEGSSLFHRFQLKSVWHVKEYTYQLLPEEEYGHFFSSEGLSLLLCKYVKCSSNVTIVCVELNGGRKSGI